MQTGILRRETVVNVSPPFDRPIIFCQQALKEEKGHHITQHFVLLGFIGTSFGAAHIRNVKLGTSITRLVVTCDEGGVTKSQKMSRPPSKTSNSENHPPQNKENIHTNNLD